MLKKIKISSNIITIIRQKPLISFLSALILIVTLLFIARNFSKQEKVAKDIKTNKKPVEIFNIDEDFIYKIAAVNEEAETIEIFSQVPGIISNFYKSEGSQIRKDEPLLKISSNYSGLNQAEIQLSIAKNTQDLFEKNYEKQIQIINLQKELAEKNDNQSETLKEISKDTLKRSKEILSVSESLLEDIRRSKDALSNSNTNGQNDSQLAQIKQSEINLLSSINTLKSSIDQITFSTSDDREPAKISEITKEITIEQLDIQRNTLENTRKINQLNVNLAQINVDNFIPRSPCNGILNQIYLNKFDVVNPNTKVATIKCHDNLQITASAQIPSEIANRIDTNSKVILEYDGQILNASISYISKYPINDYQNKIKFLIKKENIKTAMPKNLNIKTSVKNNDPRNIIVPIDSIYQSENKSLLYIPAKTNDSENYVAQYVEIKVQKILGAYAIIESEQKIDKVIVTRGILNNDLIELR